MQHKEVLELCASNPEAIISYIKSLEASAHKRILKLCASNPEAVISYIKSLDPLFDNDFDSWLVHPERPDCSLSLFKQNSANDFCGYVYTERQGSFMPLYAYSSGYLKAANKLIEIAKMNEINISCSDSLGYPIFYLVSHCLELKMKEIIERGVFLIPEDHHRKGILKNHNLVLLWDECEKIVLYMGWWEDPNLSEKKLKEYKEDRETIRHFIEEIDQNSNSQAFRYPKDNKGKPFLIDTPKCLNVSALSTVSNWLSDQLERINTAIEEYSYAMAENEALRYDGY